MQSQHPLNKKKGKYNRCIHLSFHMFKPSQVDEANMGEAELVLYHD
jgi:hypothetical protein